jgi:RNA-binding protein YhbY
MTTANIQLGKQGITDNFIISLQNYFKTRGNIRISVLKNARAEGKDGKTDVKKYSDEIVKKLGKYYTAKIIGFTIVVKKWRKARL